MAITQKLNFKKHQLRAFALLFRSARLGRDRTQLQVATDAFGYDISHCKVSRIERAAMPKVDAHCLERLAVALDVPKDELIAIDPQFADRAVIARAATRRGFWFPKHCNADKKIV